MVKGMVRKFEPYVAGKSVLNFMFLDKHEYLGKTAKVRGLKREVEGTPMAHVWIYVGEFSIPATVLVDDKSKMEVLI